MGQDSVITSFQGQQGSDHCGRGVTCNEVRITQRTLAAGTTTSRGG